MWKCLSTSTEGVLEGEWAEREDRGCGNACLGIMCERTELESTRIGDRVPQLLSIWSSTCSGHCRQGCLPREKQGLWGFIKSSQKRDLCRDGLPSKIPATAAQLQIPSHMQEVERGIMDYNPNSDQTVSSGLELTSLLVFPSWGVLGSRRVCLKRPGGEQ